MLKVLHLFVQSCSIISTTITLVVLNIIFFMSLTIKGESVQSRRVKERHRRVFSAGVDAVYSKQYHKNIKPDRCPTPCGERIIPSLTMFTAPMKPVSMNFDLLDDAILNDGFGSEINFDTLQGSAAEVDDLGDLPPDGIVEEIISGYSQDLRGGLKRDGSWDDLVRCVSDESDGDVTSDGDITKSEREELQEFLKDVGISESPPPPLEADAFECWGATISPVSAEQKMEPVVIPHGFDVTGGPWPYAMPPPNKRMRVQPPYAYPVTPPNSGGAAVPSPPFMPGAPPLTSQRAIKRKGSHSNKTRTTRQFVPFEEMQRLMASYGPIKTLRKRKSIGSDENGSAKMDSIKRKFYRWFPDFEVSSCLSYCTYNNYRAFFSHFLHVMHGIGEFTGALCQES